MASSTQFSIRSLMILTVIVTEVYEKGLVTRGVLFKPWAALKSYQTTPEAATVVVVIESTSWRTRPCRVYVGREDRADFVRTLFENGVPPATTESSNDSPATSPS